MRLYEFVSRSELNNVKKIADKLWHKLGIDIAFTNHFFDRVNDHRNFPKISAKELSELFIKQYHTNGHLIKNEDEATVVLQDLFSQINIPVLVTNLKHNQKRLLAKTVMRTDNFKTPEKIYKS